MLQAPAIQLPKENISLFTQRARKHYLFFMCVLNVFNFTNVKLHLLQRSCSWLPQYSCDIKLFFFFMSLHYAASSVGDCQQENSSFKSHFLQVHLFQTKIFEMHFRFLFYIWVRVDCRPTSQQIYKRTSSNLIRKGTGCDEYVEDQLNVASKNFAKYLFDDTDGKRYL